MALNSVIPIRPRPVNDSPMSQAWQQWLGQVGAYSDLADSVIYRHMPQSQLNTAPVSIPNDNRLPNIIEDGETLSKVAPATKRITGQVGDTSEGILGTFQGRKPGFETRGNITVSNGVRDSNTWKHEIQHALLDRMDYKNRPTPSVFFDRKTNEIVPQNEYYTGIINPISKGRPTTITQQIQAANERKSDFYRRSHDEYLANQAARDIHPANEIARFNKEGKALPLGGPYPEERVISIRPNFMQNLKGITKGALGALGVGADYNSQQQLKQDVNNLGTTAGYTNWIGLQTYDPRKDYL